MTKYAIISDIHANFDALELVMKDAEKRNVDKFICLGDLVNKYFYPDKVIDAVQSSCDIVIKGNHEESVTTNENFKWVRSKIGNKRLEYLANLPLKDQITINKVLINLYHATPDSLVKMFNPVSSADGYAGGKVNDYNEMFIGDKPQVNFAGHSHIEYIGKETTEKKFQILTDSNIILSNEDKAIVNSGSVGEVDKLRNGSSPIIQPYVTYVIVDDGIEEGKINVEIIKVPYKETLKNIYFDRINMINSNLAPKSPKDNLKIHDSLIEAGFNEDDLKESHAKLK